MNWRRGVSPIPCNFTPRKKQTAQRRRPTSRRHSRQQGRCADIAGRGTAGAQRKIAVAPGWSLFAQQRHANKRDHKRGWSERPEKRQRPVELCFCMAERNDQSDGRGCEEWQEKVARNDRKREHRRARQQHQPERSNVLLAPAFCRGSRSRAWATALTEENTERALSGQQRTLIYTGAEWIGRQTPQARHCVILVFGAPLPVPWIAAGGGARPDQSINGHAQRRTGHLDETSHAANLIDVCQAPREFASQVHSE